MARAPAGREARERAWRQRRRRRRLVGWTVALLLLGLLGGGAAAAGVVWFVLEQGRTPREWAPYLERRADKHNALIVEAAGLVAGHLRTADRLARAGEVLIPPGIGADPARSEVGPARWAKLVAGEAQLRAAVAAAEPGDVIQLMPGTWRLAGKPVMLDRPGTPAAPIVLRAARLGDAILLSEQIAAIQVAGPHWVVENLVVRGVCGEHRYCEHAFHVTGAAEGTVLRNNRLEDMNAHIKVNGEGGKFPDGGRIEGNTLVNAAPRDVRNPITPIDLVAASGWMIAGNFIADFHRKDGGPATYGAFVKGAGERNVIERNVVLCAWKLPEGPGPRIGLSIGGGGTDPPVARDLGRSGFEQTGGVIRDNLVAFCNDVGIYVNRGVRSLVAHNTLIDTAGIGVRFPESSAEVSGNIIDGVIQARDGGLVRARDNAVADLLGLFLGRHPQRELFADAAKLDLAWRMRPTAVLGAEGRPDLCGRKRPARAMPGAVEDYAACR